MYDSSVSQPETKDQTLMCDPTILFDNCTTYNMLCNDIGIKLGGGIFYLRNGIKKNTLTGYINTDAKNFIHNHNRGLNFGTNNIV